jgi:hypothetical protein
MAEQHTATLLAVLVARSERTHDEIVGGFLRCAQENNEDATLSARTLQRWMSGSVQTAPRPAQRRVAQLYWGYPMTALLSPVPPEALIAPPMSRHPPPTATLTPDTQATGLGNNADAGPDLARLRRQGTPGAAGALLTAHHAGSSNEEDALQRRTVLRTLTTLAAATASPMVALEALRHGLEHLVDADPDEWDTIAADYAITFYSLSAVELIKQLGTDLTVLEHTLAARPEAHLHRVAAQLSVVMAMALASAQQLPLARRWWRTARRYADQSRDLDTRIWVRDWEVVNGTYERRPVRHILNLADETISLAGDHVCRGTAGVWSGRAQALALAGRVDEAINALHTTAEFTERMPATVVADAESMFGWPEVRLRHTESYVYTHLGGTSEAMAAQDRALELYPVELARERAQLQMHRARCHILRGDVADGLRYAASVLDELPVDQHNALLYEVGQHVMQAVPTVEHRRAEYGELHERLLTLPAGREP